MSDGRICIAYGGLSAVRRGATRRREATRLDGGSGNEARRAAAVQTNGGGDDRKQSDHRKGYQSSRGEKLAGLSTGAQGNRGVIPVTVAGVHTKWSDLSRRQVATNEWLLVAWPCHAMASLDDAMAWHAPSYSGRRVLHDERSTELSPHENQVERHGVFKTRHIPVRVRWVGVMALAPSILRPILCLGDPCV
eukprot:Gb_29612 [translate_table: standard]